MDWGREVEGWKFALTRLGFIGPGGKQPLLQKGVLKALEKARGPEWLLFGLWSTGATDMAVHF